MLTFSDQQRRLGYDILEQELSTIGMNLLPPFHLNNEPRNDFGRILGTIHRFSVRASRILHPVGVWPFLLKMKLNTLFIGGGNESTTKYVCWWQSQE